MLRNYDNRGGLEIKCFALPLFHFSAARAEAVRKGRKWYRLRGFPVAYRQRELAVGPHRHIGFAI